MTEILDIAKKDGRWTECPACKEISITAKLRKNLNVCPYCDFHMRIDPEQRAGITFDEGYSEVDFSQKLKGVKGYGEGFSAYEASIKSSPCVSGIIDFSYMGGTMGTSLGHDVMSLLKYSSETKKPVVFFCASGGVRVQEGILGLMQMMRTVHERIQTPTPVITVYTDPCYGGVTASFSSLADFIFAEKGARIGFAGPRVIETTIFSKLPDDFQTASRMLSNGFVDEVVHRRDIPKTLSTILKWL